VTIPLAAALLLTATRSFGQGGAQKDPAKATAEGWQRIVDPLTAEVTRQLARRYETLADEYIVAIRGLYEVRRAGDSIASLALGWSPARGVTATYEGAGLDDPAGEALRTALRVVWEDTLMADFSSRTRTARRDGDLYVLTEEREAALEKTFVDRDYGILRRSRTGKTKERRLERTYERIERQGRRYLGAVDLKARVDAAEFRAECEISYGTRDGLPFIERTRVGLETAGQDGAARRQEFDLLLENARLTRIEKTGRGLERDRQDAVTALRLAARLDLPDRERRLQAVRGLAALGVHGRLALGRLQRVARGDPDPEVRQAAALTVQELRSLELGPGERRPDTVRPISPDLDPRLIGTWRARYVFRGTMQVETVVFTADGRITSEAVNLWGAPRFRRRGTWSFGNGVLYVKFAGQATSTTRLFFLGQRRVAMTINQQQRTYDRIQ
jgi:hypothetical protein